MTTLLHQNIAKHVALSDRETEQFCNFFKPQSIRKKQFILQEGDTCTFEAFVTKGLFRVYHLDQNGFEQVLYFAMEDWWITDIDSFTNQRPVYVLISKQDKDLAFENIPAIEKLFRIMTQKTHVALQRRMIDYLGKTADQRYIDFSEKYSLLAQRLSNIQIAAYLGISHEFLSKIRKKLSLKK
ncbi:cAMP-binding domain of CRP or a regulatory subunit of cAMP-dependent protein kinases [Chryseolinea serpens]|uniref:cAMP-binding domain of CRP or a regulatory subunit of cAMP-dependent protein kinases n=1 Tax=Chryseolinea serpens TaxID=947013 RepID=A0A1M5TBH2_9BACT|nr:Crp/Fnr family transcriptional regulator [Chryseolinea serpens]SHH48082.1 cAMP-binding domain of CRP or a regulatory subunit of cAMP-dependent protein kinases [Chryseolinea serpens]